MSEETKREKFVIELDERFDFGAIASSKFITSNDLCAKVSELFHLVFADFEGCVFNATGNEPTIDLFFNHGEYPDAEHVATEKVGTKSIGSTIIERTRSRDRALKEGDRFFLTEDGKDVIKDLLTVKAWNNGNPNFSAIASETSDGRGPVNSYIVTPQYTKVSYISVNRLCGLLFGAEDEEGNELAYSALIMGPATNTNIGGYNQYNVNYNYILNITRVSAKELNDFCVKIGLAGAGGLNIIR